MPNINPLTGLEYSPKGGPGTPEEKKINPLTGLEYSPTQSILTGRASSPGSNIDLSYYSDPLSAYSKYNVPTRAGVDWNELRARNQSLGEKATYGLGKLVTTAASTAIGGSLGFYYGIVNGLAKQSWTGVFDNPITRATKDFNDYMSEVLPNYYTRSEQEPKTLGEAVSSPNFWTDKFLNGVGFMAGALITGAATGGGGLITRGIGLATKAAGSATRVGRFGRALTNTGKLTEKAIEIASTPAGKSRVLQLYNGLAYGESSVLMAASEASIEALDIKERIYQEQLSNFLESNPEYDEYTVPQEVKDEFERISDSAGNSAFGLNMAVLLASNHIQFNRLLNPGYKPTVGPDVSKMIRLGKDGLEEVAASRLSTLATRAKPYLTGVVTEAFQEGTQFGIGEYEVATRLENKDMYEGFNQALEQVFGSVEGLESMVLGGLIGGPAPLLTRKGRVKEREQKQKLVEGILQNQGLWRGVLSNVEVTEANQQLINLLAVTAETGQTEVHEQILAALLTNSAARMQDSGVLDMHLQILDKAKQLSDDQFIEEFGYSKEQGLPKSKEAIVDDLKAKLKKSAEIRSKVMEMRSTIPKPGFLFERATREDRELQQEVENYYLNVIYNKLSRIELTNTRNAERQQEVNDLLAGSAATLTLGSINLPYSTTTEAKEGAEDSKDVSLVNTNVPSENILEEATQLKKAIETLRSEGKVTEAEKLYKIADEHVRSMKELAKLVEAYDQVRKLPFTREGYYQLLEAKKENQRKVKELRQKQIDEEARIAIAEATTVEQLDAAIRPETDPKLKAQAKDRRKELQDESKAKEEPQPEQNQSGVEEAPTSSGPGTQMQAFEVEATGKIDESIEGVTANGNSIIVNGQEYVNPNYSNPADAISKTVDENGVITIEHVQLETKSGEQVRFTGTQAEDIAYIITLASLQKSVRSYEQLELDFSSIVDEAEDLRIEEDPVDVQGLIDEVRYINELLLDAYDLSSELRTKIKESRGNPELRTDLQAKFKQLGKDIGYFKSLRNKHIQTIAKTTNKSQAEVRKEIAEAKEVSDNQAKKVAALEEEIAKLESAIAELETLLNELISTRATASKTQQKAITKEIASLRRKIKYRQNKLDKLYRAYEETEIQPEFDSKVDGEELADGVEESTGEQVDSGEVTDTVESEEVTENEAQEQTEEAVEDAKESGDPIEDSSQVDGKISAREALDKAIKAIRTAPNLIVDPENEDYYMEEGNPDGPRYRRVTSLSKPDKAIPKHFAHRGTTLDYVLRNVFGNSADYLILSSGERINLINRLIKEAGEVYPEIAESNLTFTDQFVEDLSSSLSNALSAGEKKGYQYITDLPAMRIRTKNGEFAGTIDMIIVDPYTKTIQIVDFKTASRSREADYRKGESSLYAAKDAAQLAHYALGISQYMGLTEPNIEKFIKTAILNFVVKQGISPKTIQSLATFEALNVFGYESVGNFIDYIKSLAPTQTVAEEEVEEESSSEEDAYEQETEEFTPEALTLTDVDVRLAVGEFELTNNQLDHDADGNPIPGLVEIETENGTIRIEYNALAEPDIAAAGSEVELELREDATWWKDNAKSYKGEEWKAAPIFVKQNGRYIGVLARYNQTDKSGSSRQEIHSLLKKGESVKLKVSQKLFSNWTVSKNNNQEVVFRNIAEEFPNASLLVANEGSVESPQEWLEVYTNPNQEVDKDDLQAVLYWGKINPRAGISSFTVKDPNGKSIAVYASTRLLTPAAKEAARSAIIEGDTNRFEQIVGLNVLPQGAYYGNALFFLDGKFLMKYEGFGQGVSNTLVGVTPQELSRSLQDPNYTPKLDFYVYSTVEGGKSEINTAPVEKKAQDYINKNGLGNTFMQLLDTRRFQVAEIEKQPPAGKFLNPIDQKTVHNSYYEYLTSDWGLEPRTEGKGSNAILTASTFNNNGSVFFNIGLKFEGAEGSNVGGTAPASPTLVDPTETSTSVTTGRPVSKRKRSKKRGTDKAEPTESAGGELLSPDGTPIKIITRSAELQAAIDSGEISSSYVSSQDRNDYEELMRRENELNKDC